MQYNSFLQKFIYYYTSRYSKKYIFCIATRTAGYERIIRRDNSIKDTYKLFKTNIHFVLLKDAPNNLISYIKQKKIYYLTI